MAVGDTAQAAGRAVQRYYKLGVRTAGHEDLETARQTVAALPGRLSHAMAQFSALSRGRQADEIAQLVLTWFAFFASGGGFDLEGGLPDLDMAVAGMGAHRTVFTHSILLGLEVESSLWFGLAVMDALVGRMPESRHPVWARIAGASRRYTDRSVTGIWAGIGAHLMRDAGLLSIGATKPVVGLPVHLSMAGHKLFLAANGVASVMAANPGSSLQSESEAVPASSPRFMGTTRL
jgi:hypothetical protein